MAFAMRGGLRQGCWYTQSNRLSPCRETASSLRLSAPQKCNAARHNDLAVQRNPHYLIAWLTISFGFAARQRFPSPHPAAKRLERKAHGAVPDLSELRRRPCPLAGHGGLVWRHGRAALVRPAADPDAARLRRRLPDVRRRGTVAPPP